MSERPAKPSAPHRAAERGDERATAAALGAWRDAQGHVDAALAVLLDPVATSRHSVVHLVRAWQSIATTYASIDDERDVSLEQLAAAIRQDRIPWVPEAMRGAVADVLEQLLAAEGQHTPRERPKPAALLAHARLLQHLVRSELRSLPGRRQRARWRATWVLLLLLPAIVYLATEMTKRSAAPWHGRYYHNPQFQGDPWIRRDRDVRFDWKAGAPFDAYRQDQFTVRWDTCLVLDGRKNVAFQLSSDDGSRLWVAGQLLVDNSGSHSWRARAGRVELGAGTHHLRVDYEEHSGSARVALQASLDGETPRSIPAELLRYPGDRFDDGDPCRDVRGPER